jgi:hypothetical protein
MMFRSVRAKGGERWRTLPGDGFIPDTENMVTHAVTIRRPRCEVWPWLVQMGGGRAGWYSYDAIDNDGQPSSKEIVPELQHLTVGDIFPAKPGVTGGFVVLAYEAERFLTLGWRSEVGAPLVTWTFVLEELDPGRTRLIVRVRAAGDYKPPFGLPQWTVKSLVPLGHFVMERKQLLGIASRVETGSGPAWTLDMAELGLAPVLQE